MFENPFEMLLELLNQRPEMFEQLLGQDAGGGIANQAAIAAGLNQGSMFFDQNQTARGNRLNVTGQDLDPYRVNPNRGYMTFNDGGQASGGVFPLAAIFPSAMNLPSFTGVGLPGGALTPNFNVNEFRLGGATVPAGRNIDTLNNTPSNLPGGAGGQFPITNLRIPNQLFHPQQFPMSQPFGNNLVDIQNLTPLNRVNGGPSGPGDPKKLKKSELKTKEDFITYAAQNDLPEISFFDPEELKGILGSASEKETLAANRKNLKLAEEAKKETNKRLTAFLDVATPEQQQMVIESMQNPNSQVDIEGFMDSVIEVAGRKATLPKKKKGGKVKKMQTGGPLSKDLFDVYKSLSPEDKLLLYQIGGARGIASGPNGTTRNATRLSKNAIGKSVQFRSPNLIGEILTEIKTNRDLGIDTGVAGAIDSLDNEWRNNNGGVISPYDGLAREADTSVGFGFRVIDDSGNDLTGITIEDPAFDSAFEQLFTGPPLPPASTGTPTPPSATTPPPTSIPAPIPSVPTIPTKPSSGVTPTVPTPPPTFTPIPGVTPAPVPAPTTGGSTSTTVAPATPSGIDPVAAALNSNFGLTPLLQLNQLQNLGNQGIVSNMAAAPRIQGSNQIVGPTVPVGNYIAPGGQQAISNLLSLAALQRSLVPAQQKYGGKPEKAFLGKLVRGIGKGIFEGVKGIGDFGLGLIGAPDIIDNSFVDRSKFLSKANNVLGVAGRGILDTVAPGAGSLLGGLGSSLNQLGIPNQQMPTVAFGTMPGVQNLFGGFGNQNFLGGGSDMSFLQNSMPLFGASPTFTGGSMNPLSMLSFGGLFADGGAVKSIPEGLVGVQTELGEKFIHLDGTITDVNAVKLHKDMDEQEITDILFEGTYVASNADAMKITREEADEIFISLQMFPYEEHKQGKIPQETVLSDLFPAGKNELTPAELTQIVKSKFKTVDRGERADIFNKQTNEENILNRVPYLTPIIQLNEEKRKRKEEKVPKLENGGGIQHANLGAILGGIGNIAGIAGTAIPFISGLFGGNNRNQNALGFDRLSQGMISSAIPMNVASQIMNIGAQRNALQDAQGNLNTLVGDLTQFNNLGTLTGVGSQLAQQTDLPRLNLNFSRLQNFDTSTPNSFINAAGTPIVDVGTLIDRLGSRGGASLASNINSQSLRNRNALASQQFNQDRQLDFNITNQLQNLGNQQTQFNLGQREKEIAANNTRIGNIGSQLQTGLQNQGQIQRDQFNVGSNLDLQLASLRGQQLNAIAGGLQNAGLLRGMMNMPVPTAPAASTAGPGVGSGFLNLLSGFGNNPLSGIGNSIMGMGNIFSQPFTPSATPGISGVQNFVPGGAYNSSLRNLGSNPLGAFGTLFPQ